MGAGDEPLEHSAEFGFGGEVAHVGEVRGGALVEDVQAPDVLEVEPRERVGLDAREAAVELLPCGALAFDEPGQVEDHSNCLCLTVT